MNSCVNPCMAWGAAYFDVLIVSGKTMNFCNYLLQIMNTFYNSKRIYYLRCSFKTPSGSHFEICCTIPIQQSSDHLGNVEMYTMPSVGVEVPTGCYLIHNNPVPMTKLAYGLSNRDSIEFCAKVVSIQRPMWLLRRKSRCCISYVHYYFLRILYHNVNILYCESLDNEYAVKGPTGVILKLFTRDVSLGILSKQ